MKIFIDIFSFINKSIEKKNGPNTYESKFISDSLVISKINDIVELSVKNRSKENALRTILNEMNGIYFNDAKEEPTVINLKMSYLKVFRKVAAVGLVFISLYLVMISIIDSTIQRTQPLAQIVIPQERGTLHELATLYNQGKFSQIISSKLSDDETSFYKALAYYKLKNFDQAIQLFQDIENEDYRYDALWNLSIIAIETKNESLVKDIKTIVNADESIINKKEILGILNNY